MTHEHGRRWSPIRRAWRWPNDALGRLAAATVQGAGRRQISGVSIVEDPRFDRLFRLVPNHPTAMTFGSTVVARRQLDEATVSHELTHVAQYARLGPFFLPLYLLGAAWGLFRHGESYLANPFEKRAMRAAEESRRPPAA